MIRLFLSLFLVVALAGMSQAIVILDENFDLQGFGYSFAVSVNGVQVLSYTDTTTPDLLQASGISLVSYSGGVIMHQHIVHDNVRVETTAVGAEATTWGGVKALFR